MSARAAAAGGLGTKPGSLQTQLISRTVRCGEPMGGGLARLQHASGPNSGLSAWGDSGAGARHARLGGQFSADSPKQLAGIGLGRSHRKSVEKGSVSGGQPAGFITADGAVATPGDPLQRCKPLAALAAAVVPPRS